MDSMQPEKERLDKAFADLDTQRAVLVNCTIQWKELRDHFTSLEQSLESKFQELAEKEKTLELKTKETQELLDKREQSIEANEQASLARVQHQKEAALEAIKNNEEFTGFDSKPGSLSPGKSEGNTLPQLKSFCEKMDAEGLWKFLVDHKKDVSAVRAELPSALQCAIDPAKLVLQCLEGFSPFDQNSSKVDKKSSGLPDQRRACSMLLESLVPVLADPNLGADHPAVSSNLKEQAKGIANEWKSEFEKDDLCKFVLAVSWRRQIPKLCSSLGLSEKMQDRIQYPVAAAGLASYNLPGQSNYDRSSQGVYGSSYGVGNRSPVSLSKNYAYPSDDLGSSLRGSGSYSASANYSNYHFGSGAPPPAY